MDEESENLWENFGSSFEEIESNASAFLSGDQQISSNLQNLCGELYETTKKLRCTKIVDDTLPSLHIHNFDDEQIWQQIELSNKSELTTFTKKFGQLLLDKNLSFFQTEEEELEYVDNAEDDMEERDDNPEEDDEIDPYINLSGEEDFGYSSENDDEKSIGNADEFEKTEVDDDFFSVRQMEKFLIDEEHKEELLKDAKLKNDNNAINYFENIESDDESDNDLFSENEIIASSKARNLKYDDYFLKAKKPQNLQDEKIDFKLSDGAEPKIAVKANKNVEDVQQKLLKIANAGIEKQSKFTQVQGSLESKIKTLERQSLLPQSWQMKGEARAEERETNALLEEDLMFDVVTRPAPEITDEYTLTLEDIIKQRIKDNAWDDIERKSKPKDISEYRKRIELDSSKSKLSLGEIYEKDFQKQTSGLANDDEKENPAHAEIKKEMKTLFKKLDALSNYHFNASIPEPEIKIIPLMPSVQIEEVQPVAHSISQTLAPEEIYNKKRNDNVKHEKEKTKTDKLRERRKKKLHKKAQAKAKLQKELTKDSTSDKAQALLAMKKLKNSAKSASGRTTIIKDNGSQKALSSSKEFFSKLQNVN